MHMSVPLSKRHGRRAVLANSKNAYMRDRSLTPSLTAPEHADTTWHIIQQCALANSGLSRPTKTGLL